MSEAPFTPPPGPSSQPAPSQPAPSQPASSEPAAIAAEAPSADTAAPTHSPRSALAVFSALGFLLLAGGLFYLWQEMQGLAQRPLVQPQPIVAGADPARVAALEDQVATLSRRLAELSGRPAPASPDLAPLAARIAALEQRPAPATADTAPLAATVAVLQNRLAADEAQAA
ncbi:MAG: hypothetical protein KGJ41_18380, partial [Rhodospirillales bacterium]|nr:hypothetical protein [Rhodospirillales bacterium]